MESEVVLCVNYFAYRRSFINFDEMGRQKMLTPMKIIYDREMRLFEDNK